jgi:release factor glutamine methyltransferase
VEAQTEGAPQAASAAEVLSQAAESIAAAGCETPEDDAKLLVAKALSIRVEELDLDGTTVVTPEARAQIESYVARRREREPLEYILGSCRFREIEIAVDERVLIPRRETELLVAIGVELPKGARVHEVGTGSGAIALALLSERPDLRVTASDLSPEAAERARENAQRLGVALEVTVAHGIPDHVEEADLLIANLPYITPPSIDERSPREARAPARGRDRPLPSRGLSRSRQDLGDPRCPRPGSARGGRAGRVLVPDRRPRGRPPRSWQDDLPRHP